ncbi:putative pollen allergen Ole e 1 family [Lupinus albus]|uniref:Putative pollen allergen Ole e 1 family n=1 Tax=Lupinus albus TaxID=3870 RepID=A0A6A4NX86_LUPAL|nr:putative pollen allergen Ole e 1 family [Lupinus albus]
MQRRKWCGRVTLSKVTDASWWYKVEVDGDHEDDICEVKLIKSPRPNCSEIDTEFHLQQSAKVSITKNNGIVSDVQSANPLGFLRKEHLPSCAKVLKDLGVDDDGTPI